jgi:ABC-2 type transport system ATP-binding protein
MEEATKLCENVALLNDGHIVEYGNPYDICRKYNKTNEIIITTVDGQCVKFLNQPKNAMMISEYFSKNSVSAIHSSEPNLESVFIEVTGRKLV